MDLDVQNSVNMNMFFYSPSWKASNYQNVKNNIRYYNLYYTDLSATSTERNSF